MPLAPPGKPILITVDSNPVTGIFLFIYLEIIFLFPFFFSGPAVWLVFPLGIEPRLLAVKAPNLSTEPLADSPVTDVFISRRDLDTHNGKTVM